MISSHVYDLNDTGYEQLLAASKKLEQRLIGAFNTYTQLTSIDVSESIREQMHQSILSACSAVTKNQACYHLAKSLQALLLIDLGRASDALLVATMGIESQSQSSQCWHALGHAQLRLQQYTGALKSFARAMQIAPTVVTYRTSRAFTLFTMGNTLQAFNEYRALAIVAPNNLHVRTKLFECSRYIEPKVYSQQLEEFVLELLSCDEQDRPSIAPLCNKLLVRKYDLSGLTPPTICLEQLEQDHLWHQTLRLAGLRSVLLEQFISVVREHCIQSYIRHGNLDRCEQTVRSISELQASTNYLLDCEPRERLEIDRLIEQNDSDEAYLILAMYVECPWLRINTFEAAADNSVSDRIRAQYERYPYPGWQVLPLVNKASYRAALQLQNISPPDYWATLTRPLRVLVAGCGTGRHALSIAKYLSFVEVTAVDLSSTSLEYAAFKARELGIQNVSFVQRDLLSPPNSDAQFDVIECSGVLHHTDQPDLMLRNLRQQLMPGGLIKLGLYSQFARQQIADFRRQFRQLESVHQARKKALANASHYSHIVDSPDFWNTSGCVDLLLNQHEDCYSWPLIKRLLSRHNLSLEGVCGISLDVKNDVAVIEGEDVFDQWHQYEVANPNTFASMYQFYVAQDYIKSNSDNLDT